MKDILRNFHPLVKKWFKDRFSGLTDIQEKSWPKISEGKNVLITAPTGSGKTLTAFLWAINGLITGNLPSGRTSVLYISPLKALNNDIRNNLNQPLAEICELFNKKGETFPEIRVLTRSGDTSQEDRRKMIRRPPEILITTPESLNLMLTSKSGQGILNNISSVILDEIHAVAGSKRGVHLITAVDRLVLLSGDFQRICLSATLKEKQAIAQFVGGYEMKHKSGRYSYEQRPVEIIQSDSIKNYGLTVCFPEREDEPADESVWDGLAIEFKEIIEKNRSTLFFTNGRRLCEKMTYKINKLSKQPLAYSHHGSLSKQLRTTVEQHLKEGQLKAIVATSSLEMGIDIGNLDEVVMIQSPPSISSAVQRVGRAGHHIDTQSRGTIFCAHPQDLISSAVLAKSIDTHDLEPISPIDKPLDILAQILISMTGHETWDMDQLFWFIKTSWPYRDLTQKEYDLVLNMLAGRYSDTRIRELKPRLSIDRIDNTVAARKGALLALYTSGGTIPDRGYFNLRHSDTNARIGELDEEYVWEAKIGQVATIGTQNWKIQRITHNDVFAVPIGNRLMDAPFWIAEGMNRDFHFSKRILGFLETAEDELRKKTFKQVLENEYFMVPAAAKELIRFLKKQKEATQTPLPHRHHLLLEYVRSGPDGSPGSMLVLHTLWGGQLNRPYAMALEAAWERKYSEQPEIFPGNDAIVIQLPHKVPPEELLSLVPPADLESLVKDRLESSGFFSARFRECAGRALLVIKNKINQRMPLWMTRLKSKKLLENILAYEDFPILLETWRTCLQDEFNLTALRQMLSEVESGKVSWSQAHTSHPSPFAAGMAWNQINQYMYQEDQGASSSSSLDSELIRNVVFSKDLRPAIAQKLITDFESKRRRTAHGYSPNTPRDLVDWVKERLAIPQPEWNRLMERIQIDHQAAPELIREWGLGKLAWLHHEKMKTPLMVSLEWIPKLTAAWYTDESNIQFTDLNSNTLSIEHLKDQDIGEDGDGVLFLGQWLGFYGPVSREFVQKTLAIKESALNLMLESLIETRQIISGRLSNQGSDQDICDSENFETLLRISRSRAVPAFEALDIEQLPLFLAHYQGLDRRKGKIDNLFDCIEQLICLPMQADLFESDIIPARIVPYHLSFLDTLLLDGDLTWLGAGKNKLLFCFKADLDFLGNSRKAYGAEQQEDDGETDKNSRLKKELEAIFEPRHARYDFTALLGELNCDSARLSESLWQQVWQSKLTNERFSALRKGVETRFKPPKAPKPKGRSNVGRRFPRAKKSFSQWKGELPLTGHWFRPQIPDEPLDIIEAEELNKDRVRLLLDRYGILFRELLLKEMPQFQWPGVFRSLRLMELAGEILSGQFFTDIPGPQFVSQKAFRMLQVSLPADSIYFMNAVDPASVCGIGLGALKRIMPERRPGTHLVFKGSELKLVSKRNGKELVFHASADDEELIEYLSPLKHLLNREFRPLNKISIETINGKPASKSPYLDVFHTCFEVLREHKRVTLYKKII